MRSVVSEQSLEAVAQVKKYLKGRPDATDRDLDQSTRRPGCKRRLQRLDELQPKAVMSNARLLDTEPVGQG